MIVRLLLIGLTLALWGRAEAQISPEHLDFTLRPFDADENKNAAILLFGYGWQPSSGTTLVDASFDFQRTIDKDLAVIWSPLPLGLVYRLPTADGIESAVSWRINLFYDYQIGIDPQFDSFSRLRLSDSWDFEFQLEYGASVPVNDLPSTWSLGLSIGSRWRLPKGITLSPGFQLVTQDALMHQLASDSSNKDSSEAFGLAVPLVLALDIPPRPTLHLGLEAKYYAIGTSNDLETFVVNLYWHGTW